MEVQWKGSKGELQMGEIEMWEQWRKVGKGQEGEGRGVQHAGVSAATNETDATNRGSGVGARPRRTGASTDAGGEHGRGTGGRDTGEHEGE